MDNIIIYLGSKNKSSWSLRAWLMLLQINTDFDAVFIQLDQPDTKDKIAKISPSKKIPVLKHGDQIIWDSLAIGEYLAETFPAAALWPMDSKMRAIARSISCEMHAGFHALRQYLPFDLQVSSHYDSVPKEAEIDIQRICEIWQKYRDLYANLGDFLFGKFTIADAMFAPVVIRFINYNIKVSAVIEKYMNAIMLLPEMKMWCNDM